MKLILASASARRQELLKRVTEEFEIIVSDFDEDSIPFKGDCCEYVKLLAKGKALDVERKINDSAIIIGCDTIVSINNQILGKPNSKEEAIAMLKNLSGKVHEVYSGIAVLNSTSHIVDTECVCTKVKFSKLTDEEIIEYVNSGDPLDKAGAYGIQGKAGVFVEEIQGDYYSVVGLPLNKLNKMLKVVR